MAGGGEREERSEYRNTTWIYHVGELHEHEAFFSMPQVIGMCKAESEAFALKRCFPTSVPIPLM